MLIRHEAPADVAAIAGVTTAAFAEAEHSDGTEAAIVERLRADGDLALSLVAIEDGEVMGHVAFSPVTIDGAVGRWFGLGPVSVSPEHQRRGIGKALIRAGLAHLEAEGAQGCVVLGSPDYYRRFGFEHDGGLRYPDAPPEYFMRLPFGAAAVPRGIVAYAAGFGG